MCGARSYLSCWFESLSRLVRVDLRENLEPLYPRLLSFPRPSYPTLLLFYKHLTSSLWCIDGFFHREEWRETRSCLYWHGRSRYRRTVGSRRHLATWPRGIVENQVWANSTGVNTVLSHRWRRKIDKHIMPLMCSEYYQWTEHVFWTLSMVFSTVFVRSSSGCLTMANFNSVLGSNSWIR